jgi:hypothetical protein
MKSGWLTSLSALALHSDVQIVRLRCEQGPPPCIHPLLIRPCLGGLISETKNPQEFLWVFLFLESLDFLNFRLKIELEAVGV